DRRHDRGGGGTRERVARVDAPADVDEREGVDSGRLGRRPDAVGRPEEEGPDAACRADDGGLRAQELPDDGAPAQAREPRVAPRVVADGAAPSLHADELRPGGDAAPDDEEGRARARAGEDPQEARGIRTGTVVEGERDVAAVAAT